MTLAGLCNVCHETATRINLLSSNQSFCKHILSQAVFICGGRRKSYYCGLDWDVHPHHFLFYEHDPKIPLMIVPFNHRNTTMTILCTLCTVSKVKETYFLYICSNLLVLQRVIMAYFVIPIKNPI